MKILFVTWDGPETNYIENLFVPIFRQLQTEYDYDFHIIQFTWSTRERFLKTRMACEQTAIPYTMIPVFRKIPFLGVLKAIFWQSKKVKSYAVKNKIDIIMPRATTAAAIVNKFANHTKFRYLFDADGFSQDERVDFSGWSPTGLKYKMYRTFEYKAISLAHGILVRSHKAKSILTNRGGKSFNSDKITVITNGKDSNQFNHIAQPLNGDEGIHFIYAGSLGPQYMFAEMMAIFKAVLSIRPTSTFIILTGNETYAKNELTLYSEEVKNQVVTKRVPPNEVPIYLQKSDIGFALRKPTFSMQAVAPIKLSEYLLCGLPVIANPGIGDTESILKNQDAAFLATEFQEKNLIEILNWCLASKNNASRKLKARALGLQHFSLDITVERYNNALQKL